MLQKPREPETIEAAIALIGARLDFDAVGAALTPRRGGGAVRAWADPDQMKPAPAHFLPQLGAIWTHATGEPCPIAAVLTRLNQAVLERGRRAGAGAAESPKDLMVGLAAEVGDVARVLDAALKDSNLTLKERADLAVEINQVEEKLRQMRAGLVSKEMAGLMGQTLGGAFTGGILGALADKLGKSAPGAAPQAAKPARKTKRGR